MGSSSSTTVDSARTARAMATAWRWPPESTPTLARTEVRVRTLSFATASRDCSSMSNPRRGRSAGGRHLAQPPAVRSWPRNRFAVTSRFSHSARSWNTVWMPRAVAACGLRTWTSRPSSDRRPRSGSSTPAMIFIRVDLPAPLSPTSPITSPRRTSRSAPRRASTAPKLLTIPPARRWAAAPGASARDRVPPSPGVTASRPRAGRARRGRHDWQNAAPAASPLQTSALLIDESLSMTYRTPSSPTAL